MAKNCNSTGSALDLPEKDPLPGEVQAGPGRAYAGTWGLMYDFLASGKESDVRDVVVSSMLRRQVMSMYSGRGPIEADRLAAAEVASIQSEGCEPDPPEDVLAVIRQTAGEASRLALDMWQVCLGGAPKRSLPYKYKFWEDLLYRLRRSAADGPAILAPYPGNAFNEAAKKGQFDDWSNGEYNECLDTVKVWSSAWDGKADIPVRRAVARLLEEAVASDVWNIPMLVAALCGCRFVPRQDRKAPYPVRGRDLDEGGTPDAVPPGTETPASLYALLDRHVYLECVFPFLGVRYISVNDGYDSDDYKGVTSGMDVVLRNIIYEAYSKDLSVKTTTAKIIMMKQGKYIWRENAPMARGRCVSGPTACGSVWYSKAARRYDPFEDSEGLLLDVVRAGAAVADCDAFMDYCLSYKMLPLRDAEFWRYGDFFAAHRKEAQPMIDTLFNFVSRYGLPVWEPQSVATTTYPARYEQRLMALHQDEDDDMIYMVRYGAAKQACQSTGAVPVCTVALILLDFYLRFIEGIDDGQFSIRRAEWMISCGQEKTPELFAQVYDLTTCINLSYTMLTTGQGKAVRQCKHCQKFFIADDWRAEYCSPRCRGAYNSKMTRKRVKERKMREGQ